MGRGLCKVVWQDYMPLAGKTAIEGSILGTVAVTMLALAILGTLGKLQIPSIGKWGLYTGGAIATTLLSMVLYFHHQEKQFE